MSAGHIKRKIDFIKAFIVKTKIEENESGEGGMKGALSIEKTEEEEPHSVMVHVYKTETVETGNRHSTVRAGIEVDFEFENKKEALRELKRLYYDLSETSGYKREGVS